MDVDSRAVEAAQHALLVTRHILSEESAWWHMKVHLGCYTGDWCFLGLGLHRGLFWALAMSFHLIFSRNP